MKQGQESKLDETNRVYALAKTPTIIVHCLYSAKLAKGPDTPSKRKCVLCPLIMLALTTPFILCSLFVLYTLCSNFYALGTMTMWKTSKAN